VQAGNKKSSQTGGWSANGGGRKGGGGAVGMKNDDEINRRLAYLPQTDLGTVERFVARWGHVLRWCVFTGWYYYDGKRWSQRGVEGFILRAEHATVRGIQDEAKACQNWTGEYVPLIEPPKAAIDDKVVDLGARRTKKTTAAARKIRSKELTDLAAALRKWGRKSEGSRFMKTLSKHGPAELEIQIDELDADPWKFNVNNGTLHFHKPASEADDQPPVTFHPHDPADLITKISPVDYDPKAVSPEFDKFFARVQPDPAQRRMLLQWDGYSLTGDVGEQRIFVHHGTGRNGKGVFVETCAYVAGDYAGSVPVETFLGNNANKSGSGPTPDLAKLPGVRYLRCGEPDGNARLNEALIKRVTGGDPIDARPLMKAMFTFFPQFKLRISCNTKPVIRETGEGMWGRMTLVPWNQFIPENERDAGLGARLRSTEGPGILNRLLEGLRDYFSNGLVLSDATKAATAKYRSDTDHVGRFLEDCTVAEKDARTQSSLLHEVYLAWAKCNGAYEYSNKAFTGVLDNRPIESKKSGSMFWLGIKLIKEVNDFVDHLGKPLTTTKKTEPDQRSGGGGDDDITY
jgi:putative DNA primase/helicase